MKKSAKVLIALLAIFVFLIISYSLLLNKKITDLVVGELENTTGCQVKYEAIDISLFRHFPSVGLTVDELLLTNWPDTLLQLEQFEGALSLSKVFSGQLELEAAKFTRPIVNYTLNQQPETSHSVSTSSPSTSSTESEEVSQALLIKSFVIEGGMFRFYGEDSMSVVFQNVDVDLQGELTNDTTSLIAQLSVAHVDYMTQGFSVKRIPLTMDASILYSDNMISFAENKLAFGDMVTHFDGDVQLSSQPVFDITFDAPNVGVTDVLYFLPHHLINDIDDLTADGEVALKGYVKGEYNNAESLPAFAVELAVSEGWMKYNDLPEKLENISAKATLIHPLGTSGDSTVIDIHELYVASTSNFIKGNLNITTPVSDVKVNGHIKSDIDFAKLKHVFPISATSLVGKIDADIRFDGYLSDIEEENYEAFQASGYLNLKGYYLKNKNIPQGLSVKNASLGFSPAKIDLKQFSGKLGSSDLVLKGYLSNYFAYMFDDKALKGELSLSSRNLDLNEFLDYDVPAVSSPSTSTSVSTPKEKGAFVVPNDLDLVLLTKVNKLTLDHLVMTNCNGKITVKESRILLDDLKFATLDGQVNVNGQYNTQKEDGAFADLKLKLVGLEISKAVKSFSVLQKMIPKTQVTEGKISADMEYYALLDAKGEVDLNSIKSKGNFSSPGLHIANNGALNSLAKQLKNARYSDITTSPISIDYAMNKGKLSLSPFDMKLVDKNVNMRGWYNINETLNFQIKTTVKAKEIGGDVSKYIGMVSDVNKPLPVTIILSGDAKAPNVKYDTREAISILRKDVSKNLNGDAVKSILKGFFK